MMETLDSDSDGNQHKKLRSVPSITISEEANSKYRENLLKQVDMAFERERKTCTNSETNSGNRKSYVFSAVKAYEAKLNQTSKDANFSSPTRFSKVYKEWTEVAQKLPSTPNTRARRFSEKQWIVHEQSPSNSESAAKEVNFLDSKTKQELKNIAKELLSTEETYVEVLYILDQVFFKQILEASQQTSIPESVAKSIFENLSAIYLFHSTYLLPQLGKRLEEWDQNPRIGDIMIQAAPFLKMYALYIDNHSKAIETIQIWKEKSKDFADIVQKLEGKEECKHLSLENHMLTPVQRTPRYKMLLENYLSHLPDKSSQRKEVEDALEIVGIAADHSNNHIKSKEKSLRLLEIYRQLSIDDFDTENFTRELIKEGKVIKIAARNGREHDRYLYLFDDVLLCCKDCNPIYKVQGKIHQEVAVNFDLSGVSVSEQGNFQDPTFLVQGIEKQNQFLCSCTDERDAWVSAINKAVANRIDNKNSFRRARSNSTHSVNVDPIHEESPMIQRSNKGSLLKVPTVQSNAFTQDELGMRAPLWVKNKDATMCMICAEAFHVIMRRRHHCRACGRVVCSSCSQKSLTLSYQPNSPQKVCDACFNILSPDETPVSEIKDYKTEELDLGELVLSSHLYYQEKEGSWVQLWCVIPLSSPQTCLCFKAKVDLKPIFMVSFTGCEDTSANTEKYSNSFCLLDVLKQKFVFASDDCDVIEEWMDAIEKVANGNLTNTTDVAYYFALSVSICVGLFSVRTAK